VAEPEVAAAGALAPAYSRSRKPTIELRADRGDVGDADRGRCVPAQQASRRRRQRPQPQL